MLPDERVVRSLTAINVAPARFWQEKAHMFQATRSLRILTTRAVLAVGFAAAAFGGERPSAPPEKTPSPSPLSFADGKVVFDVQERLRLEIRDNNFDFNSAVDSVTDGSWLLQRFRIGMMLKPVPWLKIYGQGQGSWEFFSDRPLVPGAFGAQGDDSFDLRQAYVDVSDYSKCPWGVKVGRQILAYGDDRLIGPGEWTNFARTFDAVKITCKGKGFAVDAFASTPAVITRNTYNQSDLFNGTGTGRELVFSGLYATFDSPPFGTVDLYTLLVDQPRGNTTNLQGNLNTPVTTGSLAAHSDFVTLGTRIKGDPKKLNGWEFQGEFVYQTGTLRGLDLNAFAATVGVGYNFDAPWKPRLYAEFNHGSGDENPTDGSIETFQNLFPTNHKFYGIMDVFSWQNMNNALLSFRVSPAKTVTAQLDFNAFWLANTNDVWYRANGLTPVRPLTPAARSASNYAGSELDFVVTWNTSKYLQLQAGYSHFFDGTYLKDTGAHSDANFGYVQATLSF
jgi:hypothetical protein